MNGKLGYAGFLASVSSVCAAAAAVIGFTDLSIYSPSTPEHLIPGAVSQDIFSLIAALGSIVCLFMVRRGRAVAWQLLAGFQGYLFYAYALYSFDRVYNRIFLLYPVITGLTVFTLILVLRGLFKCRVHVTGKNPPRKTAAVLLMFLGIMFLVLWLSILLPAMSSSVPPEGNAIFVLDIAFFIPLLLITSILLFKGRTSGDIIAVPLLVKMGMLGLSVLTGVLIAPVFNMELKPGEAVIYALLGFGPLLIVPWFMNRIRLAGQVDR